MLLSICVLTYNRAGYLEQLLNSIVASQVVDGNEIELIVLNNGSSDSTDQIITKFQEKVPLVKLENESNLRGAVSFRKLIDSAKGKWVIHPGDDDIFLKDGLSNIIKYCKDAKVTTSLIPFGARTIDSSSKPETKVFKPPIFGDRTDSLARLFFESSYWMPATAFRREAIVGEEFPRTITTLDWWLWITCTIKGDVQPVEEAVILYRVHDGQEQRSYLSEFWELDRLFNFSLIINRGVLKNWMEEQDASSLAHFCDALVKVINERKINFTDKSLLLELGRVALQINKDLDEAVEKICEAARLDPRLSFALLGTRLNTDIYKRYLEYFESYSSDSGDDKSLDELESQLNDVLRKAKNEESLELVTPFEWRIIKIWRKLKNTRVLRKIFAK